MAHMHSAPRAPRVPAHVWTARVLAAILLAALVGSSAAVATDTDKIPKKAYDVLREIQERNGEPPPGYVGGRQFGNFEGRLPKGKYREYDVNRKVAGRSRGKERIVVEQRTGRAWYTVDHYETFLLMKPEGETPKKEHR